MRTVAIIQARLDSRRLPYKALMTIGPRSILGWTIHRTQQVRGVDEVVAATTHREVDDLIALSAESFGVECFRGATDDVLERFFLAAARFDADRVLRVTADCPLMCPVLNTQILEALQGPTQYVSMSTYSNGLVQEAFTFEALDLADENAETAYEREHVVPWMLRNVKMRMLRPPAELPAERWCVDTAEDLEHLRRLYKVEPGLFDLTAEELVQLGAAGVS